MPIPKLYLLNIAIFNHPFSGLSPNVNDIIQTVLTTTRIAVVVILDLTVMTVLLVAAIA